jgi:Zn-dependent peptidase ImmA (M78 family)/transcriptional regulator with XRE-family HTH domain
MTTSNYASEISSSGERFNPQMCVLARDFAGMTQTELAGQLNVSQGTVSKTEEGIAQASDAFISDLSRVFERPIGFFTQNPGVSLTLEGHFRKKSALQKKQLKMADARMNIARLQINRLIENCSLDFHEVPTCDPDEYQGGPKEIAAMVRRFLNVPQGPIPNLVEVVESAGCIIRFLDFGTLLIDGFAVLSGTNMPIIFINKAFSPDRRRLTLAHEFGHIIMHRGRLRPNMDDEAFEFAGEFMMPSKEIKSTLYPLNLEKLARLKLRWKISMAAILQHGKRIGAVNERYYRYIRTELSKNGFSKTEPYEDMVELEKPTMLTNILRFYKNDLGYSIDDVAKLLRATHHEVSSLARPNHERFSVI